MTRRSRREQGAGQRDRGAIAVLSAALVVLLFGMAALTVDLGTAFALDREVQSVADGAALAGGRELPDAQCAWTAAYDYLRDEVARRTAGRGFDVTMPAPAALADGDETNGEILLTTAAGDAVSVSASAIADGCADDPAYAERIRVVAPPWPVSFHFATALPGTPTGTTVSAGATVEIRSPRGLQVLPFLLSTGCATSGQLLLTAPAGADTCGTDAFGVADAVQATPTGEDPLVASLRSGFDHPVTNIPLQPGEPPVPGNSDEDTGRPRCRDTGDPVPGVPGATYVREQQDAVDAGLVPNCLAPTGRQAATITEALVGDTRCDGRLVEPESVLPVLQRVDGATCPVDGTPFSTYDEGNGRVDGAILRSPRFFLAPVLYSARPGGDVPSGGKGSGTFLRVVDYVGVYLGCSVDCSVAEATGSAAVVLPATVLSLDSIDLRRANTGDAAADTYAGFGPGIPVLVHDPMN